MKRMKFTDRSIAGLKHKTERYWCWEEGRTGLGVRVAAAPSKLKTWQYGYRFNSKSPRLDLGHYPAISLKEVRQKWRKAVELRDHGQDPKAAADKERRAEQDAYTLKALAEEYITEWISKKDSAAEVQRIIRREIISVLGMKKAKNVTRGDVKALLNAIVARNAPVMANRVLSVVRALYNWALYEERGGVTANPAANIKPPGGKEKPRTRVLSSTELRSFWHGLDAAKMTEQARLALRLQTVLLQRKGEILSAEWPEFDLVDRLWTIPRKKAKNDEEHIVPLSGMALSILEEVKAVSGKSRWLFPSPHKHKRDSHITGNALSQAMLASLDVLKLANATPHDLRRTGASTLTSMKVPRLVVDKILNHVDSGVSAVYDTYSYMDEKRDALERWADRLTVILNTDEKVVELETRTA